ncbi:MAG: adenylate/guanylate cyclase domain-containing protein [Prolixibacteraceae bacterium]|jgi:adenylate cyclase|nr:adenylate/guanylate cyclase domain-containing protein [Prolixibacteraceae bacterium]
MIESYLIESVLSSLFDFLKKKVITTPADRAKFDFIIKDDDGKKIAIEVKGQNVTIKTLLNIERALQDYNDIDEFYLITPEEPPKDFEKRIKSVFKDFKIVVHWMGINQFIQKQNLGIELNDDIRSSLLNLQVAAVTSKFEDYDKKFIGSHIGTTNLTEHLKHNIQNVKEGKVDRTSILFGLRRQFPYSTIVELEKKPEELSKTLKFGKKYDDAIIVLTDIKNFSTLVSVSDPEELNDLMSKYYTNARELVFKYGGILDKFIGDAVLAIFNYPIKNKISFTHATKFCAELILMGENILNEFQRKLDQEIETGTRVGLATGPIYALNIGKEDFEVTFIGDKINFAARLEKNCDVNGILMSNRFFHKLDDSNHDFIDRIEKTEKKIDPKDAKGQVGITTAWQIQRNQMEKIVE